VSGGGSVLVVGGWRVRGLGVWWGASKLGLGVVSGLVWLGVLVRLPRCRALLFNSAQVGVGAGRTLR
jgi:hypothetical protein